MIVSSKIKMILLFLQISLTSFKKCFFRKFLLQIFSPQHPSSLSTFGQSVAAGSRTTQEIRFLYFFTIFFKVSISLYLKVNVSFFICSGMPLSTTVDPMNQSSNEKKGWSKHLTTKSFLL